MIVVDARAAPGVPVLGDRKDGIRPTVAERFVQVGGVTHGVGGRGAVDETFGRRREDDLEDRPGGHRSPVLVEDRPPLRHGLVPYADVVVVSALGAFPARGWLDEDDGVGVAVDGWVAEIGVVAAAVLPGGGEYEGSLLGGLLEAGALYLIGRLDSGAFERVGCCRLGGGIFELPGPGGVPVAGLVALGLPLD